MTPNDIIEQGRGLYTDQYIDEQLTFLAQKIDPRIERYNRGDVTDTKCESCGAMNCDEYMNCWVCTNNIHEKSNILIGYKAGGKFYTPTRYQDLQHQASKHAKDMLQPYKYSKARKKMVPDARYIKAHGIKSYANKEEVKYAE